MDFILVPLELNSPSIFLKTVRYSDVHHLLDIGEIENAILISLDNPQDSRYLRNFQ
ncbi:MAG: hypothetical protein U0Z75_07995 [Deinococcaceae bacterium]